MPVEWHWYDTQKSIIHFTFQAPWTSDEFRQANQSANAASENMDHVVDAIFKHGFWGPHKHRVSFEFYHTVPLMVSKQPLPVAEPLLSYLLMMRAFL